VVFLRIGGSGVWGFFLCFNWLPDGIVLPSKGRDIFCEGVFTKVAKGSL
jgi:hypothetical protein